MKTMNTRIAGLLTIVALSAWGLGFNTAWAEEDKPNGSADIGILSKYVWRGYELSDDSIVIQPSATVSYKGFSFNLWGNLDTDTDGEDESDFNETDWTLSYDTSIGPVDLGVGYIYYSLDYGDDAEEFYISAGLGLPLSPTLTIYREVADLQGWYMNLGISHSFDLPRRITLDLAGSLGYYRSEDDGFVEVDSDFNPTTKKYRNLHDGLISVGLTIPWGEFITFSPSVAYSFPLSSEADDLITAGSLSNDSDFLYGGVTLSVSF